MTPRPPQIDAQEGFIIIEVLVSALILAIVAGAVLTLITATTRGAAAQRDRSVAYDLAQADQARLRVMRLTEINGTETGEAHSKRNGTEYTVISERVFVNNKVGAVSCTEGTDEPDYVQLTSTVTSPTMLHPVVLQSVVSPSTGSLDTKYGNLAINTTNALGEPVGGVSVTVASRPAITGTEGCANFVSLPEGKYKVAYNGNGLINEKGEAESTLEIRVEGGKTYTVPPAMWDRPATLAPEFVYVEPGTGELRPAPVDSMYVVNAASGQPARVIGIPGGTTRSAIQTAEAVFPFKSPSEYTVFAGSCASNNPGTAPANAVGLYSAVVPPASVLNPQIHVPSLELTVTNASGAIAVGAKVTVTDANTSCKSGGSSIKRTYKANAAGHLSATATGQTEAGLPYGTYNICASLKVGTEVQSASQKEVKVQNFTTGTSVPLKLAKGGSECA
jgi:type II secretory pathway pseudopilin PulG